MKQEITKNDLYKRHTKVIAFGGFNGLLTYRQPNFFNSGKFGWNWDAYTVGTVAVISGYRNYRTEKRKNYQLIRDYHYLGRTIVFNPTLSDDEKRELVDEKLIELLELLE